MIKKIWSLLEKNQKKTFLVLFFFNILIISLELISLSTVFPIIYSINNDLDSLKNFGIFDYFFDFLKVFNSTPLTTFLIVLLILIILKNLILAVYTFFESKFIFETQEKMSLKLFSNLIYKNYRFHLENNSADLITRVRTDSDLIREVIFSFHRGLKSIFFLVCIFIFLMILDQTGFLLSSITFFLLSFLFYKFSSKKTSSLGEERQLKEIMRTKRLQESFSGIKEIKTFLKNKIILSGYEDLTKSISKTYYTRDFIAKLPKVFLEILIVVSVIILTITMLYNPRESSELLAILSVFGLTAIKALPHMSGLLASINTLKFSGKVIDYYHHNLINKKSEIQKESTETSKKYFSELNIKNISFSYPNNEKLLFKDFNVDLKKGEIIQIKGTTGSGKSTLIDIILGLQTPQSYKIYMDGKELKKFPHNWLENFSYVPQSIYLFDTSIKNNITMEDNNDFNETLFFNCLEIAEIKDFIESLPKKANTPIGELGSNLSGGQRQRLGIARALYKNSNIIILDEATNALDPLTEQKIYENFDKIKKDKILLIVNHRNVEKLKVSKVISVLKN